MSWDTYSRYYDWELEMLFPEQNQDIEFWKQFAQNYGEPILEIACGSGRVTIPLLKAGFQITAIDFSEKMLALLKQNAGNYTNLELVQADMRHFSLENKFAKAFISYFSLQQLLTIPDMLNCLQTIHKHLQSGGKLGLDIMPCVCEGPDKMELSPLYSAPFQGKTVTMYSSYQIDRLHQIKHWQDKYYEVSETGRTVLENKVSLKECPPDLMELLLEKAGFRLVEKYGGFQQQEITTDSQNILYIAQKI